MSTSLANCRILLSKETGDHWVGTATSDGAADFTTIVDTSLLAKNADWIDNDRAEMFDLITHATVATDEERRLTSLLSSTLTLAAHSEKIVTDTTYEIHRLFSASEKRRALVDAAKTCFPHLFAEVRDESMVSGNWLKDGGAQVYTDDNTLTYWTASGVTVTKNTTLPYYKHGSSSATLDTAAGYIYQDIALNSDLQQLAGKTVTFSCQGWCDTASCLRIGVLYDGTNLSYSSYHDGDSAFTENSDPLEIEVTIDDNPTDISFRVYHAVAAGTSHINDLRVIGPDGARIYIGDLGLAQDKAHQVLLERSGYSNAEPWSLIHGVSYADGYMYIPGWVSKDYRLRIKGIGYLDFYDTSDAVGTDWADTIDIDSPQTKILVAQAAIYLCNQKIVPNDTSGTADEWKEARAYWADELEKRKRQFSMKAPDATIHWS